MRSIFTIFILFVLGQNLHSQTGIEVPQMKTCDQLVTNFLNTYDIPGATFALSKNGKLVYMRGFGTADIYGQDPTQPYHKFRIASVSKPITSIAIMKLMQNGKLKLSDKVFGPGGILENHLAFSKLAITDTRIFDITVQHLLEHSAGWDRDINCFPDPTSPYPYWFGGCDPIVAPLHVAVTLGVSNPATDENMISYLLLKGLDHDPGTFYAYSNIGYLVLGEIIEEISEYHYEKYVQDSILSPLGICDMELGKNIPLNLDRREAGYNGNGFTTLSCYNTGKYVPWEYGGFNIEAMGAHGGWIATARDLVKLVVAVDGYSNKKDILSPAIITTMVKPSVTNPNYAKGWSVNNANNWWHTGSLDGTASFIARTSGGYTWAIILNKRVIDASANAFWSDLDALPWNCISSTSSWPTHDLNLFPTNAGNGMATLKLADKSVELSWNPGDGDKRIMVLSEGSINHYPLDGINYVADDFGLGSDLGSNTYVVYNGTGNYALVKGLKPETGYNLSVFEYNQNPNTGNYPLYLLCNNLYGTFFTPFSTSTIENLANNFNIYPNPFKDEIVIKLNSNNSEAFTIEIMDSMGKQLKTIEKELIGEGVIDMREFASGLYLVKLTTQGKSSVVKMIKE